MAPQKKPYNPLDYEDYNPDNYEDVSEPKPADTFLGMAGKGLEGVLGFGKSVLEAVMPTTIGSRRTDAIKTIGEGIKQPFVELATPRRQGEGILPDIGERIARSAVATLGGDYEDIDKHWTEGNYGALAGDLVVPVGMGMAPKMLSKGKAKPKPTGEIPPIRPEVNPAVTGPLSTPPQMSGLGLGETKAMMDLATPDTNMTAPITQSIDTPPAPSVASPPVVDPAVQAAKLRQAIRNIETSAEKLGRPPSERTQARLDKMKADLAALNVPTPPVFVLKPHQQTPMTIKKLMQAGYTMDKTNPVNADGSIRYTKTGPPRTDLPVLEAEVPLKQKQGGIPPPDPPKKGIDQGPITPEPKKPTPKEEKASIFREAYELSRALISIDLPFSTSAAFRQALPHVGTKNWAKAWLTSVKSYGSEATYQATMKRIKENPLFRERPVAGQFNKDGTQKMGPSFAEEIGVKMTDLTELSKREEATRSKWAEQIPVYGKVVRASNRAYTSFLNDLRASTLENMVKDADIMGQGGMANIDLMKKVADFINDTTGRASLKVDVGLNRNVGKTFNFEKSAKILTDTMFSPRLMASRIRMLNPSTYLMAPPGVRKAYTHAMMRSIGAWWTISSLSELMGAEVSKDPNSADFGKIKIGDTRIDPGGGFQQFLVLGSRMRPEWAGGGGITSSTSGKFTPFGEGYKPDTRASTAIEFGANKLHPTLKFAYDLLRASENRPVNLMDRTVQMYLPIIAGDIAEIIKNDPSLLPLVMATGTFGMGTQTYSGGIEEPSFIPDEWDIKIGDSKNSRRRR